MNDFRDLIQKMHDILVQAQDERDQRRDLVESNVPSNRHPEVGWVRRLSPKEIAGEILALVNKVNNSRLPWRKQTYHHSTLYRTKDGICTVFIVRRDDHEVLYPHNPFEVTVKIRLSDRDRDWVRLLITQGLAGTNLDPYRYRNLLHATPAAPGNRPNQPAARQRTAAQAGARRTG